MAYEKQNWECGETITADKLNHMEDGIAAGGDCDCGFECETTTTLLTNETVTTASQGSSPAPYATLAYSELISAETIKVTFNGTEYECPRIVVDGFVYYGGIGQGSPDFSQYPFVISSPLLSLPLGNRILTETAGTYSVKIEGLHTTVTTTPCFVKAVRSAKLTVTETISENIHTLSHSWQEISDAFPNVEVVLAVTGSIVRMPIEQIGADAINESWYVYINGQKYRTDSPMGCPSYLDAGAA